MAKLLCIKLRIKRLGVDTTIALGYVIEQDMLNLARNCDVKLKDK